MLAMRRRINSPALSQKSPMSAQLSWRVDGSPYTDLCPPTPQWNPSPLLISREPTPFSSPDLENDSQSQIAWNAYYSCSRRMNSACVANRAQSVDEQLFWWEETSRICRNAIFLHTATLGKQYDLDTAKHLEALESADLIVQTMLETLSFSHEMPVDTSAELAIPSRSMSSSSTLVDEETEITKRSKRHGFSTKIGKFFTNLTAREPIETQKLSRPDSMLYY